MARTGGGVVGEALATRTAQDRGAEFCRALARTLGPAYRVGLYATRPPTLLGSWGRPRGRREVDPVLPLLASPGPVVNHRTGGGGRVSVLPLDPTEGLVVAVEVDGGALARASRLLASMADPEAGPTGEPAHLGEAIDRMIEAAAVWVGAPVPEMSRAQKQQVVRYLDERGAFLVKKAVEQVAARLGVSRFTIYNYLDETNRTEP